jgi:hypothetical protein
LPLCTTIAPIPSRSGATLVLREHQGEFWGKGKITNPECIFDCDVPSSVDPASEPAGSIAL